MATTTFVQDFETDSPVPGMVINPSSTVIVATVSRILGVSVRLPGVWRRKLLRLPPMEAETETKVIDRESTTRASTGSVMEALAVGKTVGRYDLIHRLGHGGMAAVFLGRATGRAGFEKLVAVKVIHPHLGAEPEFVEMFLDEARIAARICHPHVVEIHDLGDDDGVFYMVMEYVEGETLASLLRQLRKQDEHLPISAVLQIAADACEGLAAAHDLTDAEGRPMHLVHRDVSPHNLLVGMDGRVKVVDFGIAKATGRRSSTRTGQLRGKLAYMSPEQAGGESIDHRTDLFALGSVIWELLTNDRLFVAETESETLARVHACVLSDIREVRSDIPEPIAAFMAKALARDPDERFASAHDMLRDVRGLLRGLDESIDPRGDLAKVMDQLFSARVGYIHAAVRRAATSGSRPREHAANDPIASDDATKLAPSRSSENSGIEPARPSGSMALAAAGPTTQTQTLTSSLAAAPARHWTLWLVLPLLGAAVGAMLVIRVLGWGTEATAIEDPRKSEPVLSMERQAKPAPAPELSATIRWHFDIDPAGTTVYINDIAQRQPSPVTIEVPRGDDEVEVKLVHEGYKTKILHPAPLAAHNFTEHLDALPATAEDSAPVKARGQRSGPWLTAPGGKSRGKPKGKPKGKSDAEAPPEPTPPVDDTKAADDKRGRAPMPDFNKFFDESKDGKAGGGS